jgi:hypothetical protein
MAALKDMYNRLASLVDELSTGQADLLNALLRKQYQGSKDISELTGTLEITVCAATPYASRLTRASFVAETGVTAAANSRDMSLWYDNGAAGTAVELTTDLDGTAVTTVAGVTTNLTVTANITIPAGSRLYFESTHNSSGVAWDETFFEAEIEGVNP